MNKTLIVASQDGNLDVVKYLVSRGANIHAEEDWALCQAANNGHLDIVKYLKLQERKDELSNDRRKIRR